MIFFRENIGHVFGRMPRRMPRRDDNRTELELVAILDRFVFKSVTRAAFVADKNLCRFHLVAKLARTAHEIGMNVRLKNVRDRNIFLAREFDININVGARIKNGGDPLVVIADEIGNFRKPFSFYRFKYERHALRGLYHATISEPVRNS